MYVCIYLSMYLSIYLSIYIHTHTHTQCEHACTQPIVLPRNNASGESRIFSGGIPAKISLSLPFCCEPDALFFASLFSVSPLHMCAMFSIGADAHVTNLKA